ncbi:MAG TPA: Ig-like domain-containing protein, partial [Thermoanaerobaculia bacterium]|nr:Ig-like domain-containing protein [Thermoanaerobaculia bacterium]
MRFVAGLRVFAIVIATLLFAIPMFADNVTVSGNVQFSALDGSSLDHDGSANGTFTVSDGDLNVLGTINCNDDGAGNNSACAMRFAVSGNLDVASTGAIYAENRTGGGNGGNITFTVGGNVVVHSGAVISSGTSSTGNGGNIVMNVSGSTLLDSSSTISASSTGGDAGDISITGGGSIEVRGLVASGPSRTISASKYTGAVLTGGSANAAGGDITIRSTTHVEPAIIISSAGTVVSEGQNVGSGTVALEGCGIIIKGLVATVADEGTSAKVVIRSGTTITVDGRDLGASGTRLGMIRADALQQSASGFAANLFARNAISVLGPTAGTLYAMNSNGGTTSNDASGTINVIATAGGASASGNAFSASGNNAGDQGGAINVSARDNVNLDTAKAKAAGGTTNPNRKGGSINVRSYSGSVSWQNGSGDVRPTGSGSGVPAAQQGTITLTYCTTVSTSGSTFPTNGAPVGAFPTTVQSCSPAAPSLPNGESHPDCNDPPIANPDAYTVAEGGTLNVAAPGVLTNDTDPDGDPITAILVSGPTHATSFALNADGSFTYVHDGGESTTDSFTYKANDGFADSNVTTVTITITPVNDPPVANNDTYAVNEGGTLNVAAPGVLANDTDPDGPTATAILVSGPAHASSFVLNPNGSFIYVHDGSETTSDSFTYRVSDGSLLSNIATVSITVNPVNDAPVANNDAYNVNEGGTLNVAAPGVLGNDTDADSPSLTAVLVSGPAHASSFTLNADGSFNYVHDGSETTFDSFTYRANDGSANSNIATVTITV